ncbi:MAG: hypothetical protein ACFFER_01815 [Candidatus Thorarchaeota archaeon]
MKKQDLVVALESLHVELDELKQEIQRSSGERVIRSDIVESIKLTSVSWFGNIEPLLPHFGVNQDIVEKYHTRFDTLLRLTAKKKPLRTTYLDAIDSITSNFLNDIVIEVQKQSEPVGFLFSLPYIEAIMHSATDEEKDYLTDALTCARYGVTRAAVIMGWNAATYRMHKKIESLGFDEFHKKTLEAKAKGGRFKRFKKSFEPSSLSELRKTVFDTDLLWVLEYWELIDSNQHDRLSACFVMRNNAAHPGEAPITDENLISFLSDLRLIVFENSSFKLE